MKKIALFAGIVFFAAACNNHTSDHQSSDNLSAKAQDLSQKVQQHPDSAGLRLQLVDALDSLNNYKEAAAQMDLLIRKDSLNYGLWFRKARLQESAKDTLQAIEAYNKALHIYPSPDGMLSLANLLAEKKNENALLLCQRVAELRLGREYIAHCSFISGVYYARTGNTERALQAFDNCINNDFSYMEAYQEKGFIFYDAGKYADALKIFQMAAQVNNTYADAYYWQAKCYEAMNQKAEAIKNYQTALGLDNQLKEAAAAIKRLQ
ncbi:MAG: tetratricopeptide repeat protein [Bacteroidota bacterium]|nr:tetratricopeptide repeat protein [Bacteroidota bacterium]